jgi:hypothetical protein
MITRKRRKTASIIISRKKVTENEKLKISDNPETFAFPVIGYRNNDGFLVLPKEEYCSEDDDYETDFIKLCEENGDDWREILS